MKTIIVASHNPVKINAVTLAFQHVFSDQEFTIKGVSVPSGVSDQPITNDETRRGADNRTIAAMQLHPNADFWVGVEGGIEEDAQGLGAFAWVVIRSNDRHSHSRSGTFYLPPTVAELIHSGLELGEADDIVFGKNNSKQSEGAIGILTKNLVNRTSLYEHAIILALVQFINPDLYPVK